MKYTFCSFLLTLTFNAFANNICSDTNFSNINFHKYTDVKNDRHFEHFISFSTVTPGQLFESFYDLDLDGNENYSVFCTEVEAAYFTHKKSGIKYVMYTTHEDSCDGGNTMGLVVDIEKYSAGKGKESIVAEISDSDFLCLK